MVSPLPGLDLQLILHPMAAAMGYEPVAPCRGWWTKLTVASSESMAIKKHGP